MDISDRRYYANIVLEMVKRGLNDMLGCAPFYGSYTPSDHISIQSYQNGRENGIALNCYVIDTKGAYSSCWIAFAEYRRSDEVVVYVADYDPCQALGNNEDIYDNKVFFSDGDKFKNATTYILDIIKAMKEGTTITSKVAKEIRFNG